jgi:uncharacterized protein with PQ loop repeat
MVFTEILGFGGTLLVAAAYFPQISHLFRQHCSAGISIRAWTIWLVAAVLFFTHAFAISDRVFLTLQVINLAAIFLIIILARKYKERTCHIHELAKPRRGKSP